MKWIFDSSVLSEKAKLSNRCHAEIAESAGLTRMTVWKVIEMPDRPITIETLLKLCNTLGVAPAALFKIKIDHPAEQQ